MVVVVSGIEYEYIIYPNENSSDGTRVEEGWWARVGRRVTR